MLNCCRPCVCSPMMASAEYNARAAQMNINVGILYGYLVIDKDTKQKLNVGVVYCANLSLLGVP